MDALDKLLFEIQAAKPNFPGAQLQKIKRGGGWWDYDPTQDPVPQPELQPNAQPDDQQDLQNKPKCDYCQEPILRQLVEAFGKFYHPNHFVCPGPTCNRRVLANIQYYEMEGRPYCEGCFHELFSPKCEFCHTPITSRCINALGKAFHPDHFFCCQCGKVFSQGDGFLEGPDGRAYCENDYRHLFADVCGRCEKPLVGDHFVALNQKWHKECFTCADCNLSLVDVGYYEHEGHPYCQTHFYARNEATCSTCSKPIIGKCLNVAGRRYHLDHFKCTFCQQTLQSDVPGSNGKAFKVHDSKPYCLPCHIKLYG
ncbi:paxillin [Polychytrium aggregatum]|uniref:paxillin n=1 Tax=Polychytrium aggregatum TaxID=110093 RepID=UPI0022FE85D3|nr:paxillin [Polychytrium aggregatum]KAI9204827.1 paxillin [Polychytrium aggregatum]